MHRSGLFFRTCVRGKDFATTNLLHNGRTATCRASYHLCKLSLRNGSPLRQMTPRIVYKKIAPYRLYSSSDLPEHIRVNLPALSPTMDVGTIVRWEKQVGDKLNEGDLLCEIETDKATMGFETSEEGFLAKIFVTEGSSDIPVGRLLCIIVENEADVAAFKDFPDPGPDAIEAPSSPTMFTEEAPIPEVLAPPPPPPKPPMAAAPPASTPPPVSSPAPESVDRVFASPLARKLAAEMGINLPAVKGTGDYGRIRKQDVEAFAASGAAQEVTPSVGPAAVTGPYTDFPVEQNRQELAQRAIYSKQTIPHYFLTIDIEADNILRLADELNQDIDDDNCKVGLSHFVIKAAALSCHKVPEANSSWMGDKIRQFFQVDVNVTLHSEEGARSPVVFGGNNKGLATISKELSRLNQDLSEGKFNPQDYQGGTFTVTDLSEYGVKSCGSIITPSQSCSLAMGALRETFVPDSDADEGYRAANIFSVTLACDHRVVDGAVGARWLQHFKRLLQKPYTMLL